MRIALVSTGLGRMRRGFESFTESLFNALRMEHEDIDVTLFQGGGKSGERRVVVPNFHRADFPARQLSALNANHLEKRSFAFALYPRLRLGQYDIVHYNELTMGSAALSLAKAIWWKLQAPLLQWRPVAAGPLPPSLRFRADIDRTGSG